MNRDRLVIGKRLQEAAELDPVSGGQAVEQMALSSPPSGVFAAALADQLCEMGHESSGVFVDVLINNLVSLGPGGAAQLLRVVFSARSERVVLAALEREEVAFGEASDRLRKRLSLALSGPETDMVFGQLMRAAMARGHVWSVHDWDAMTHRTPEMTAASERLVWLAHGNVDQTFRRSPEGELLDVNDDEIELPDSAVITVPYTSDIPPDEGPGWSHIFAAYDLVSVLPQFDRHMATPPKSWAMRDAIPIHRGVDRDEAVTHFVRNGWMPRKKGSRSFFDCRLRGDVVATVSWHASDRVAHLIELYFATSVGAPLFLGDVDEVAYAEALATLSELDAVGN